MREDSEKLVLVDCGKIITRTPQYVRSGVYEKLKYLVRSLPAPLILYEGWRSTEKQTRLWNEAKLKYPNKTDDELNDFVARPDRAVHVTGGAVDVGLVGLDCGEYLDFENAGFTAAPEQSRNRKLLSKFMADAGFFDFKPEWWHFSYGDFEWAAATGQAAIYEPLSRTRCE